MIFWVYGQTGAGKTTYVQDVAGDNDIILDGDEMRLVWPGLGYSLEDRMVQHQRIARLAVLLDSQRDFSGGSVLVATIMPTTEIFNAVKEIVPDTTLFKYIPGGLKPDADHPFENYKERE